MIRSSSFVMAIFGGLAIMANSSLSPAQQPRPNVVFILMDDLRFDELVCLGHPFVKTPNIDRLAKEGATFKNAFATTRNNFHTLAVIDLHSHRSLRMYLDIWFRTLIDEKLYSPCLVSREVLINNTPTG